jgi:hypothetical protein
MATLTNKPLQVYLRPEQLQALRALARRRKTAISELVRQGVDEILAGVSPEEDPLSDIVGMFDSGAGDLAAEHDRHLADAYAKEHRPRHG